MTPRSSARVSDDRGFERRSGDARAISQPIGVVALLAITVALVAVVAVGVGAWSLESPAPTATFDLTVDGERSTIAIEHVAGDSIDVTSLTVHVTVNDEELAEQPPVPFVGAAGFGGAPEGPFNAATDPEWRTGERAAVTVAGTNDPGIEPGDSVTVTLVVDDYRVATLEETAS